MERAVQLGSNYKNNNKENEIKKPLKMYVKPLGLTPANGSRKRKLDDYTPLMGRKRIKNVTSNSIKKDRNTGMSPNSKKKGITAMSPFTKKQCIFRESLVNDLKRSCKATDTLFKLESFPNVISVEGNIGCGKSTLLKNLEKKGYTVLQEPVNSLWHKYLPLLYSDPKRWGCTFQLEVLHWFDKLRTVILPQLRSESKPIIIERSPQSSFYIFCQNLFDSGLISEWEVSVIKRTYDVVAWKPAQTVYLQLDPTVCCNRIKQRNRNGENEIDIKLIGDLHNKHEEIWANNQHKDIEVWTVDATQSADKVAEEAFRLIENRDHEKPISG